MALIKCPECNQDVSDTAKICVHCGYELKEENKNNEQNISKISYCTNCGNEIKGNFCTNCGNSNLYANKKLENDYSNSKITCPKCESENTNVQLVSKTNHAGCLTVLFYLILIGIPVIGWIVLIYIIVNGRGTTTQKHCVCQNCGYSFQLHNNIKLKGIVFPIFITLIIFGIIALITTPIVLNLINQSKEAANKRNVEAYAKAIEYAVAQYEYNHNGELPADFDVIKNDVEYSNSDVYCLVEINEDANGSVELCGCQVGEYEDTYYKYSSKKGSVGAQVDNDNEVYRVKSTSGYCN